MDSLSDAATHIHFTHNMNVALHYNIQATSIALKMKFEKQRFNNNKTFVTNCQQMELVQLHHTA